MNKKIHLVCNAHLDPIWLWRWDEGAAEALSTFRVAADFCDDYDGFVFNHNEVILYEWVEKYEPELFERIKKLVKQGKWKIMGGWYLQPDCNMPSGESFIRQIEYGRKYFKEKFGAEPKTAINFDPFGHTRGLVQILKKTGFENYVFARPDMEQDDFIWRGFDGSDVKAFSLYHGYGCTRGAVYGRIDETVKAFPEKENILITWGIGNHGGGPSREDMELIKKYIEEHKELEVIHSDCDSYFETIDKSNLKVYEEPLRPSMVGCYTSMVRIKQANRRIENKMELMQRMLAQSGAESDKKEIESAEKALMLCQFHDVLPGSMMESAEEDSIRRLGHAEEICDRYITKAFFKLCRGQKKSDGEIPVFVYNPLPYKVKRIVEIEVNLADQNWNEGECTIANIKNEKGEYVLSQNEKEESSIPLDWRKKYVFEAELEPMRINRFNCELEVIKDYKPECDAKITDDYINFENKYMSVAINKNTGLIDKYEINGKNMFKSPSALIEVMNDDEDPWGMNVNEFNDKCGEFKLLSPEEIGKFIGYPESVGESVRIVENGDVRMKVEAVFGYENSTASVIYTMPKNGKYIDINIVMYSNNVNKMYKLTFDTTVQNGKFMGQTAFGSEELKADGSEQTFQKWCGTVNEDGGLYIINGGTYGGSAINEKLSISLLRTPGYSAFPIGDREIMPKNRVMPHIDMGKREFNFRLICENADYEAEVYNMPIYALSFFPSGNGEKCGFEFETDNKNILLSSMKQTDKGLLFRLFNTKGSEEKANVTLGEKIFEINFGSFEVKTYVADETGIAETDMLGNV